MIPGPDESSLNADHNFHKQNANRKKCVSGQTCVIQLFWVIMSAPGLDVDMFKFFRVLVG